MNIEVSELKSLLARAYEQGWRGFLENKDDFASSLAEEFAASRPMDASAPFAISQTYTLNATDPHYIYSSMTTPILHPAVRREEVV